MRLFHDPLHLPALASTKRWIATLAMACALVASGCQDTTSANHPSEQQSSQQAAAPTTPASATNTHAAITNDTDARPPAATESQSNINGSDTQTQSVDWAQVDSGIAPVDPSHFEYPFAPDSQPVLAYMQFFNVDAATAQYNLTVGMASNEALSRVLDQLGSGYVSHELTDGEQMQLIIHTTDAFAASRYDYVIADDFAHGLTLPIIIQPEGS